MNKAKEVIKQILPMVGIQLRFYFTRDTNQDDKKGRRIRLRRKEGTRY